MQRTFAERLPVLILCNTAYSDMNYTLQLCPTGEIVFEHHEELLALSAFWKLCDCYERLLVDVTLSQINPVHSFIYCLTL